MGNVTEDTTLVAWAHAAAAGDRRAADRLLEELQGGVYRLALRMLGHPQDAEDATQEILLIVLTHLGSFRGESSFRTWCWRVASNHLLRARRGRMEKVTFVSIEALLETGMREGGPELPEAETNLLERELRLRCTEGMLLGLDRDLRIAFVLAEILGLSGSEAAAVLELDHATYRKTGDGAVERCVTEVDGLIRAADVLRHPAYAPPPGPLARIRALLDSKSLELLRS